MASNGQAARVISRGRQQRVARIERPAGAAPTVQAVSIDPAVEADPMIWIARLRTGRVEIFRASVSRAFKAVVLIDLEAAVDLAVIASAAAEASAAVIASVVAGDLGALAGSAAAVVGSEVGAEN
jgi:hypothetical protein